MKKLYFVIAVIALIGAAVLYLGTQLDSIVEGLIEDQGSAATQTPVPRRWCHDQASRSQWCNFEAHGRESRRIFWKRHRNGKLLTDTGSGLPDV